MFFLKYDTPLFKKNSINEKNLPPIPIRHHETHIDWSRSELGTVAVFNHSATEHANTVWGSVKWKPNTRYKVTMEFVLFKSNCQKCYYIYTLGDERINSSLVERGR